MFTTSIQHVQEIICILYLWTEKICKNAPLIDIRLSIHFNMVRVMLTTLGRPNCVQSSIQETIIHLCIQYCWTEKNLKMHPHIEVSIQYGANCNDTTHHGYVDNFGKATAILSSIENFIFRWNIFWKFTPTFGSQFNMVPLIWPVWDRHLRANLFMYSLFSYSKAESFTHFHCHCIGTEIGLSIQYWFHPVPLVWDSQASPHDPLLIHYELWSPALLL